METVTPKTVFSIFGMPVTSTVIATWFAMLLIILIVVIFRKLKPELLDLVVEFLSNLISDAMGIVNVQRYLPLIGTLAILVVFLNLLGFFPIFSSPTSDLNTTIALALVVFFSVHVFGIQSKGPFAYLKDLASPIFLLPLEIIGQVSRTLSLALRLFGNILSGDLIVSIIFSLIPIFAPLPLMGLSLLIGILQAYVFVTLTSVYIASAVKLEESNQTS